MSKMTTAIISAVSFVVVALLVGMLRGAGKQIFDYLWKRYKGDA